MTSDQVCCSDKRSLLDIFPEKREELEAYISGLDLGDNVEKRRGLLIGCLHKAQEIFSYLPLEVQELVGKRLRLQQSDVYGVISFYSYFTDKPVGKYKISICTGTACFVKGADKIVNEFEQQLKIKNGETSEDEMFSLGGLRCVGACSLAPVVMVNEKVYGNVTTKMVKKIIKECE